MEPDTSADLNSSWSITESNLEKEILTACAIEWEYLRRFQSKFAAFKKSVLYSLPKNAALVHIDQLKTDYVQTEQAITDKLQRYSEEYIVLLHKEKDLESRLAKAQIELDKARAEAQEERVLQKKHKEALNKEKKALETAIGRYKSNFGFHVSTERGADRKIIATVLFDNERPQLTVKLIMDENGDDILGDFDASKILGKDIENKLRERFIASKDILGLMVVLRKKNFKSSCV